MENEEYILYLKYAVFEGEDRKMLFARKYREIEQCGCFYWGYGGYDITPSMLRPLIDELKQQNKTITALFSQTKTTLKFGMPRGEFYSRDKKNWQKLPCGITTHSKNLAFVFQNLKEESFDLNLYDYKNIIGKQTNLYLPEYLIYPIHKAVATKAENNGKTAFSRITYSATLDDVVYIR